MAKVIRMSVFPLVGVVLLVAALLKGQELLTVPSANSDIWTYRPFLILQVEFELMLAIWLLSGLWKRAAWLVTTLCFFLFSCVTCYKGLTGADSCGCFGRVHVNPWLTLGLIDLPLLVTLLVFPPRGTLNPLRETAHTFSKLIPFNIGIPSSQRRMSTRLSLTSLTQSFPLRRGLITIALMAIFTSSSTAILIMHEPASGTASYEVLEPETWKNQTLPVLGHIDIADSLTQGNWLVLLYHHDCPDCVRATERYHRMANDLAGNEDFLRLALVEIPPYGPTERENLSPCIAGRMDNSKEWFVTTPTVALLSQGVVKTAWEGDAPEFDTILEQMAMVMQ